MPNVLLRPTADAVKLIDRAIRFGELSKPARLHLNIVLAWAQGQTVQEISESPEFGRSREAIRRILHRYQSGGLDAFTKPRPNGGRGGKPSVPAEEAARLAELLRQSFERGQPLPYRELKRQTGRSLSTLNRIARQFNLVGSNRRGRVGESPAATNPSPAGKP